ncbi:MAG: type II toxin-antitoxin system HicB family antitoxin [Candidatus Paceibacterota bacterium]|jgi:predicted RNase H-like HicB family nuclease
MKNLNITNIIWKEGKYFVALCLNVEVSSFGRTKKEAGENLKEALKLYFEDMKVSSLRTVQSPEVIKQNFQYA